MSTETSQKEKLHIVVAALYKFVRLDDYQDLRQWLLDFCLEQGIRGTLLLAHEGINGTVAGSRDAIDALLEFLQTDPRFASGLEYKESLATEMPFYRTKVKLKKEIVTLGIPEIDPKRNSGIRVDPEDWNALISDPDILLIDTRNQFEYEVGTFKSAISPNTKSFREFPAFVEKNLDPEKHKRVAMFCTGGIRCEKASVFMLEKGFEEVYQLQGGILKYLEDINPDESLWEGECFVFDNRVAVNDVLEAGVHEMCYSCRYPLSPEDRQSDKYEEGVSCPHCYDELTEERRINLRERQRQVKLAEARNQTHIGTAMNTIIKNVKTQ